MLSLKKLSWFSLLDEENIKIISPFILKEYSGNKETLEPKIKKIYNNRKRCNFCFSFLTLINGIYYCKKCNYKNMRGVLNMPKNHFINAYRKPIEIRVRYCYLRQIGLSRELSRSIVGRSDTKIAESLYNLHKAGIIK